MKVFNNQRLSTLAASLIGISCLVACGQFGPEFMSEHQAEAPSLRFADSENPQSQGRVPGSYLVMFREQRTESNLFFSTFREEYAHHYVKLSESFLHDSRVRGIEILSAVDMSSLRAVEWEPEFSAPKLLSTLFDGAADDSSAGVLTRIDFDSEESAKTLLEQWDGDQRIWFAEPNEISRFSAGELNKWSTDYDAFQSWYKEINLPSALRDLGAGSIDGAQSEEAILNANTLIAVLDSGVDYEHPQLKDNIWTNTSVGAAGCADDLHGCNTTAPSKGSLGNGEVWPNQSTGPGMACGDGNDRAKCNHGTHVAGIIAAKPTDTNGETKYGGVCPFCKIMILKVAEVEATDTSADLKISDDSQIRAFKYLTRFRKSGGSAVRLINASFGKYNRSRSQAILIDVLKRVGTGSLVIAAASNEDSVIRSYPAAFANAIAVASVGTDDQTSVQKSYFSNYGSWVDISAPGAGILSTVSGGGAALQSGTSMAAPVVAGAAGLLLSAFPNLPFNELKERILNSANASKLYGGGKGGEINVQYYYPKVSGEATRRPLLGGGYVDADAMLKKGVNSATGQPMDRVTAGCAVIKGEDRPGSAWILTALMAIPLVLGLLRRRGGSWVI